jgi:hypothetical protein
VQLKNGQCMYNVILRRVHVTTVAIFLSVCMCVRVRAYVYVGARAHGCVHVCARVASAIQRATRMRHIWPSVASLAPP